MGADETTPGWETVRDDYTVAKAAHSNRCVQMQADRSNLKFHRCSGHYMLSKWWERWSRRCSRHAVKPKLPSDPKSWERTISELPSTRCSGRSKNGQACLMSALPGRRFCHSHAGSNEEEALLLDPAQDIPEILGIMERWEAGEHGAKSPERKDAGQGGDLEDT